MAGLQPQYIPLHPETHLADLNRVDPAAAARCSCLLLNYPNNPTGAVADEAFWRGVLHFCEQHDLLLIHDNPYVCQVSRRCCSWLHVLLMMRWRMCCQLHGACVTHSSAACNYVACLIYSAARQHKAACQRKRFNTWHNVSQVPRRQRSSGIFAYTAWYNSCQLPSNIKAAPLCAALLHS